MQQAAESDLPIPSPFRLGIREPKYVSLDTFMDACVIYNALDKNKKKCMIRCEGFCLDIYSNEKNWLLDLAKNVDARELYQPHEDIADFLQTNTNTVITNGPVEFPYKVYFNNYANATFADYCVNNPSIKIGKTALNHVRNEYYLRGFYFWVKTEKQLMLAKIALGTGISKIVKYVSADDLHK